jgi:hypothetical protein
MESGMTADEAFKAAIAHWSESLFTDTPQGRSLFASGAAFVLQNSTNGPGALGGGRLGLDGLTPAAGIVFDLRGSGTSTGYATNGTVAISSSTLPLDLGRGNPIAVTLTYNGLVLTEHLLDLNTGKTFDASYAVNLAAAVGPVTIASAVRYIVRPRLGGHETGQRTDRREMAHLQVVRVELHVEQFLKLHQKLEHTGGVQADLVEEPGVLGELGQFAVEHPGEGEDDGIDDPLEVSGPDRSFDKLAHDARIPSDRGWSRGSRRAAAAVRSGSR